MNQNWIVENLNNAFSTWNGKLTELWGLVTTSPQTFKGGAVWGVMQSLHNAMIGMPDINFTMSDEDNKAKILNLLGKVYMGVPSDCWLKICIVSQRMDEKSFRENVLLHRNLDGLDKWRVERNRRIRQCVQDAGNVVQHKYLILSTNKQNVTDARSRLRQVQGNLLAELSNLGCTIKPMTNNERLEVLHNFFRRGEEGRFQFSFDDYGKLGNDFRNTIAPDALYNPTRGN